jgi:hypothetical protein
MPRILRTVATTGLGVDELHQAIAGFLGGASGEVRASRAKITNGAAWNSQEALLETTTLFWQG